jgi:hypothetical protein
VKAGRSAHAVARTSRTNADVTLLKSSPLRLKLKKSSPKVCHGSSAQTKYRTVPAGTR